ncbi:ribose ABC transporter (permease) [Ruminococcaceae bacterium BL-6]|nr:ribose ABC transporter (permease) [Ruminococcaceae bacterium BL-6]
MNQPNFNKKSFWGILKSYNLFLLLIVFIVIASILSPSFLEPQNVINLWQRSAIPGIIAIGMTFVVIVGGIDLSVGSVVALSGVSVALLLQAGVPIPAAALLAALIGVAFGTLAGSLITRCNLPDFIVTMAVMTSARGAALLITNGTPIFNLDPKFSFLGQGMIGSLPLSGLIWLILTAVAAFVLKYTAYGRNLYAIGGNKEAAYLSGIRVKGIYTSVYIISGLLAAFAGIMLASWLATGQPTEGNGYELNAIAAVVLGGASLSGGIGGVIGTFGGVILLQIITNIFNLMGLSSYYQQIFSGIIIVGALLLNKVMESRRK